MLDAFEALIAVRDLGTTGKAAVRLRITQSAVSKRLQALADQLGEPVTERNGRRLELTPRALRLIERLSPLLADLRAALKDESGGARGPLVLGVSESILASWGAGALGRVGAALPGLALELHAHRSPVVTERVAAGEYMAGLIAGQAGDARGLVVEELAREPMALIGGSRKAPRRTAVLTIEERSGTWEAISRRALQLGLTPGRRLESFFAVAQLAANGMGPGLAPLGVCRALKLDERSLHIFRAGQLHRPVSLVARPSVLGRPLVSAFAAALRRECLAAVERGWT